MLRAAVGLGALFLVWAVLSFSAEGPAMGAPRGLTPPVTLDP